MVNFVYMSEFILGRVSSWVEAFTQARRCRLKVFALLFLAFVFIHFHVCLALHMHFAR